MCMGWLALHASSGVVCLRLTVLSRVVKINRAITQIGRKIIVDADLALELAGRKTGGR